MASVGTGVKMLNVVRRHLKVVDSTNSYAKAKVGEFDPSALTVVSADEQTAGRGRGDRVWKSGSGALDITATFAFPIPRDAMPHAYQLSPLIAVCAARVLRKRYSVDASLKWPNDLIFAGRSKFGGVLCELEAQPGGGPYWACLGIGINVNSTPVALGVSRPAWPLTTLSAELGRELDVSEVTDAIVAAFAEALPVFLRPGPGGGFAPFQAEYEALSVLLGRRITFSDGGAAPVVGRVVALGADGRLLVDVEGAPAGSAPRGFLSGEVTGLELAPGEPMLRGAADTDAAH